MSHSSRSALVIGPAPPEDPEPMCRPLPLPSGELAMPECMWMNPEDAVLAEGACESEDESSGSSSLARDRSGGAGDEAPRFDTCTSLPAAPPSRDAGPLLNAVASSVRHGLSGTEPLTGHAWTAGSGVTDSRGPSAQQLSGDSGVVGAIARASTTSANHGGSTSFRAPARAAAAMRCTSAGAHSGSTGERESVPNRLSGGCSNTKAQLAPSAAPTPSASAVTGGDGLAHATPFATGEAMRAATCGDERPLASKRRRSHSQAAADVSDAVRRCVASAAAGAASAAAPGPHAHGQPVLCCAAPAAYAHPGARSRGPVEQQPMLAHAAARPGHSAPFHAPTSLRREPGADADMEPADTPRSRPAAPRPPPLLLHNASSGAAQRSPCEPLCRQCDSPRSAAAAPVAASPTPQPQAHAQRACCADPWRPLAPASLHLQPSHAAVESGGLRPSPCSPQQCRCLACQAAGAAGASPTASGQGRPQAAAPAPLAAGRPYAAVHVPLQHAHSRPGDLHQQYQRPQPQLQYLAWPAPHVQGLAAGGGASRGRAAPPAQSPSSGAPHCARHGTVHAQQGPPPPATVAASRSPAASGLVPYYALTHGHASRAASSVAVFTGAHGLVWLPRAPPAPWARPPALVGACAAPAHRTRPPHNELHPPPPPPPQQQQPQQSANPVPHSAAASVATAAPGGSTSLQRSLPHPAASTPSAAPPAASDEAAGAAPRCCAAHCVHCNATQVVDVARAASANTSARSRVGQQQQQQHHHHYHYQQHHPQQQVMLQPNTAQQQQQQQRSARSTAADEALRRLQGTLAAASAPPSPPPLRQAVSLPVQLNQPGVLQQQLYDAPLRPRPPSDGSTAAAPQPRPVGAPPPKAAAALASAPPPSSAAGTRAAPAAVPASAPPAHQAPPAVPSKQALDLAPGIHAPAAVPSGPLSPFQPTRRPASAPAAASAIAARPPPAPLATCGSMPSQPATAPRAVAVGGGGSTVAVGEQLPSAAQPGAAMPPPSMEPLPMPLPDVQWSSARRRGQP